MPVLTKRSPCPCGSGKKYKHCHWDADHPAGDVPLEPPVVEAASDEPDFVEDAGPRPRWPLVLLAVGVVAGAVGFGWKSQSMGQGFAVGLAGLLALAIFAVTRDAPPPAPKPKSKYLRGAPQLPPPTERRLQ
jgi:hypothetical protein